MDVVLPKNFDARDAPKLLDTARPVLQLPPDAKLRVENVTRTARGTRIDFTYTIAVPLDDGELSEAAGVRVEVSAHGDLKFNARGTLVGHDVEPADPRQLRAISDHVSKLVANGQIYIAKKGERVDPDKLRAQGKDWYIVEDEHGYKRLRRAWIS